MSLRLSFRSACSVLRPFRAGGRQQTVPFSVSVPSIPYSSTRRKRTHCARRIFLNPRTGPGTRCDLGQNGHTKRVPCAFRIRSTITPHPVLHSLYSTGSGGGATIFTGRTGLLLLTAARLAGVRFAGRRVGRFAVVRNVLPLLRLPLRPRVVRVARIVCALTGPLCHSRPALASLAASSFIFTSLLHYIFTSFRYFLRCTICRSVRLFRRVFLPSVGKAQGVCG